MNGFTLKIKKSKIHHHLSQDGIFLSCKSKRKIHPGTLIGFYPGVIYSNRIPKPSIPINDTLPYLNRYDKSWVDPNALIPFPLFDILSLDEFDKKKLNSNFKYVDLPIYMNNPLSLGHMINHPPPDIQANVKFIDFSFDSNFFPRSFYRYFPNILKEGKRFIDKRDLYSLSESSIINIRLIGIVSINEINHNEEIYCDYIEEEMIPISYAPDWLLKPPENSPYLKKEKYVTNNKFYDKILMGYYNLSKNEEVEEIKQFFKNISNEKECDINKSKITVKNNQKRIELQFKDKNKLL